jgi:phosphatidylserine/phosphatidylglycerophosphate/cardiolipin synthase-like enzyme
VAIDSCSGISHKKVIILDGKTLITGSYNYSKNAYSRNAENVLVIHNPYMASLYTKNFEKRWDMGHEESPSRAS